MPNLHFTVSVPDDALRTRLLLEIVFCRLNFPDCNTDQSKVWLFPYCIEKGAVWKAIKSISTCFYFFFILDDLPSNGNEYLRTPTYKLLFLCLIFSLYHCSNFQKHRQRHEFGCPHNLSLIVNLKFHPGPVKIAKECSPGFTTWCMEPTRGWFYLSGYFVFVRNWMRHLWKLWGGYWWLWLMWEQAL